MNWKPCCQGVEWGLVDFVMVAQGQQADVMAAVVERAFIAEYLAQLQEGGVDPVSLDVRTAALAVSLCGGAGSPQDSLLLDVGSRTGTLTVIFQQRVALIRELAIADDGQNSVARFCGAVQNSLRGFRSETGLVWNPEKVFVTGSLSGDEGLRQTVGAALDLPVEQTDLARRATLAMDGNVAERWDGDRMDTALALALGGGRRARTFNFRREEFAL